MALSKTDKNEKIMKSSHGTTCLITQAGKADRLLDLSRIRKIAEKRRASDWEI